MPASRPPALAAVTAAHAPRRPVRLDGRLVGSVAEAHLPLLAAEPAHFAIAEAEVAITAPAATREAVLDALHRRWRAAGVIRAWRDEPYALADLADGRPLVPIERAASRFWGSLTFGAHATGYVRGADGRPAALWIAQRSFTKPTDPGLFDNLVGGGVPTGQPLLDALVREAWEEAGLDAALAARAVPARVLRIERDIAEGFQREWLYAFDLELPAGLQPQNQDGEVAGFQLLAPADAQALASTGTMTVDAALVTLDFLARHDLLPPAEAAAIAAALTPLDVPASVAAQFF